MRTFKDIYTEYCEWIVIKTGNGSYSYPELIERMTEERANAYCYKQILELCYDKKDGTYYFTKFVIGDLIDIGFPKPFRFNGLLRKWDKLVKYNKKLAILCSRGHGKTAYFTTILNIYDMFLFKHRRIIVVSASQEQATRMLNDLKLIIENNEWLNSKKGSKWGSQYVDFNNGYILVAGIGTEILGQHVDRIVIDDILRSDNKLSDQEIEDYIDMNLDPMLLNRNGQIIIVGTPRRQEDIFATIRNRISLDTDCPWKLFKFPAILDFEKKILQCPDRFSWKEIMDKRLSMGALKFAREYQLEFFSRETSLFPKDILQPAKDKGKDCSLMPIADKRPPSWTFLAAVDVARSGSVSADFTAMIVLAFNSVSNTKQIVHFWHSKGLKISEQAIQIAQISRNFGNCMVLVEQNNMGQEMIDELADIHNVYVESFLTGGVGQKKSELIRFLITAFEHEQIIIPQGDEYSRKQMSLLEDELSKFCVTTTPAGNEKFEGKGAHDDLVMSLALANKATQLCGVPFAVTGGNVNSGFDALINTFNKNESDLVKKIQMGLIK